MADETAAIETEQTEQVTAPAQASTPTPEAAEATPELVAAAASTAPPAPEAAKPKYLGQFDSPEHAAMYYKGKSEAAPAISKTADAAKPQYTQDQLWSMRAEKLQEIASAQNAGNIDQARTAAAQVNWIDNQMLDLRLGGMEKRFSGQSAMTTLTNEGNELLKPYQADLVPGNPLYEQANTYFSMMKQAQESGVPMDNILSGLAVLAAAAKTGKTTAGVEMSARQEFGKAMQGALKTAVLTGAGKAAKSAPTAPDFAGMSDDEFRTYERKLLAR